MRAACRFRSSAPVSWKRFPTTTIAALEDPFDRDRDGVSGARPASRTPRRGERRIGRFGWKGQHATLLSFSADAYRNEMGITNDIFSAEVAYGVTAERMRACDPIADPEDIRDPRTRRRGIDNFTSFMRFLAPVAARGAQVAAGLQTRLRERLLPASASRCSRRSAAPRATARC